MCTPSARVFTVLVFIALFAGCGSGQSNEAAPQAPDEEAAEPDVVNVSATEYEFRAGSTFPSGWVTLRFENEGEEPHVVQIFRLPQGQTFEDYAADVYEPFQTYYSQYRAGEIDQTTFFERLSAEIPAWFYEAEPMSGAGFTSPGRMSETTVYLEPGANYVLECYVRSAEKGDRFHGSEGMLRPLVVSEQATGAAEPESDIDITISNSGLVVDGELSVGAHTAYVSVEENPEGFTRHNVQLVQLEGDQTASDAAEWLDWVNAMLPPAPATYLGGTGQALAGGESYFTFDLEPGSYAWVSEGRAGDEFIHEFTVE